MNVKFAQFRKRIPINAWKLACKFFKVDSSNYIRNLNFYNTWH